MTSNKVQQKKVSRRVMVQRLVRWYTKKQLAGFLVELDEIREKQKNRMQLKYDGLQKEFDSYKDVQKRLLAKVSQDAADFSSGTAEQFFGLAEKFCPEFVHESLGPVASARYIPS